MACSLACRRTKGRFQRRAAAARNYCRPNAEAFVINQNTAILDGRTAGEKRNARFLQQYLFERTGFQLPLLKKSERRSDTFGAHSCRRQGIGN